ncbi:MAG: hypothetical protein V7K92_22790 [Nostoc sp.]|uniref:hypothetical protein n=1 Tax=Nostoc sp. TaxID=1180 RepID=UPI002FF12DDF
MSNLRFSSDWHTWAVIVGLGFPLLVVLLGEVIYHLKRRGRPLAATLRVVKNLVLPVLILMVLIRNVLKLDVNGNLPSWSKRCSGYLLSTPLSRTKAVNMAQQADVSFNAEVELPIRILK